MHVASPIRCKMKDIGQELVDHVRQESSGQDNPQVEPGYRSKGQTARQMSRDRIHDLLTLTRRYRVPSLERGVSIRNRSTPVGRTGVDGIRPPVCDVTRMLHSKSGQGYGDEHFKEKEAR